MKRFIPIIIALLSIAVSCGSQKKLEVLRERRLSAQIMLPQSVSPRQLKYSAPAKDSIKVQDFEGREVLIMKAVRDENGEMVATDQIRAAYVSARFRNIAERQGKVELRFELLVPASMQDSKWQLRFIPHLRIMDELKELEPVLITGRQYREKQLRGYEQYGKFLKTIIADTLSFVNLRELEIFIERFMPRLYKFKNDTSFVSDKEFRSCYGVSEKEAIEHYTNGFALRINERRKMRKGAMYRKYVKAPIVTEGLKLDTVLNNSNGDFVYEYVQTIATMPGLRKASIWLDGNIFEQERKLYTIPRSDSLNFYISSLSSLVDPREKYLEKILERQASVHSICWIDFGAGKSAIDETLGKNRSESIRIKRNFEEVLGNGSFELDSIIVTASECPSHWYNKMSLDPNPEALLVKELHREISGNSDMELGLEFICIPNVIDNAVSSLNNKLWSPRNTRLVAEISMDGKAYYYPVTMPAMKRNRIYKISKLVMQTSGSGHPDEPVLRESMKFSIEIMPWKNETKEYPLE